MKPSLFDNIYPSILLAVITVVAVSLLVISGTATSAVLERNQDQETLALLQEIFPDAGFYAYDEDTEIYTVYSINRSELGYAFYGQEWGFQSRITVLIGLVDTETIKGVFVTKQSETRSYWRRLEDADFFSQFNGLKIEYCYVSSYKNTGGQVDTVSRATVSAKAVATAVQEAALEKIEYLK